VRSRRFRPLVSGGCPCPRLLPPSISSWSGPILRPFPLPPPGGADQPLARPARFEQTPAGFADFQQTLAATGGAPAQTLVVMEATRTYWVQLANALHSAGYPGSVVNPKHAPDAACAVLQHAKTDPLDAQMRAQLGATLAPARWTPPPAIYHALQQRLAWRDSLVALRTQVSNQHHALLHEQVVVAAVATSQSQLIAALSAQIAAVEREPAAVIATDEAWTASIVRLQSIPGVGLVTAAWLVVATADFTTCPTVAAATAFAGLAPHPWQSGSRVRGQPHIGHSGHARLRQALYIAAGSSLRCNPVLRACYGRLKAAGKASQVAFCAVPASCGTWPGPSSPSSSRSIRTTGIPIPLSGPLDKRYRIFHQQGRAGRWSKAPSRCSAFRVNVSGLTESNGICSVY
jgi:transposase